MSDWPFVEGAQLITQTANAAASTAHVALTGTVGAKPSSPTEMVASTPWDAAGILVSMVDQTATASSLVDIMAGSSGNEHVLIPDLLKAATLLVAKSGVSYFFPIFIPAGTRLSGRAAVSATCTVHVAVALLRGSTSGCWGRVTAYGADVANARGTVVDAGGTAHTKGAVAQITSATDHPIRLMTVAVGAGGDFAKATASHRILVDVLAGGAGAEYPLVADMAGTSNENLDTYIPQVPVASMPVYVPKGARLSARTQSTTTDAGDRLCDVVVYGVS